MVVVNVIVVVVIAAAAVDEVVLFFTHSFVKADGVHCHATDLFSFCAVAFLVAINPKDIAEL